MICLSEELLISSLYDRIELPSEQLQLQSPLRDYSHLIYTSSLCAAEVMLSVLCICIGVCFTLVCVQDDGQMVALKSDMPFIKEGYESVVVLWLRFCYLK